MAEIHPTATVYEGTILGEGVKVLEGAVVGKQPTLSPRSTAKREELPPTELGGERLEDVGMQRLLVGDLEPLEVHEDGAAGADSSFRGFAAGRRLHEALRTAAGSLRWVGTRRATVATHCINGETGTHAQPPASPVDQLLTGRISRPL